MSTYQRRCLSTLLAGVGLGMLALLSQLACSKAQCAYDIDCVEGYLCVKGRCRKPFGQDAEDRREWLIPEPLPQDQPLPPPEKTLPDPPPPEKTLPESPRPEPPRPEPPTPEPPPPEGPPPEGWCANGKTRPCYNGPPNTRGIGECKDGVRQCLNNRWSSLCTNQEHPTAEVCDGKDNDCDGLVDEKLPVGFCQVPGKKGECKQGESRCRNGQKVCEPTQQPAPEVCDGKDNDCDGFVDNAPGQGNYSLSRVCYSGPPKTRKVGECKDGTKTCQSGTWGNCQKQITPTQESCDSKDNDCDGQIDEAPDACCTPQYPKRCSTSTGKMGCWPSTTNCSLVPFNCGGKEVRCDKASGWASCCNGTFIICPDPYRYFCLSNQLCALSEKDCPGGSSGCTFSGKSCR